MSGSSASFNLIFLNGSGGEEAGELWLTPSPYVCNIFIPDVLPHPLAIEVCINSASVVSEQERNNPEKTSV